MYNIDYRTMFNNILVAGTFFAKSNGFAFGLCFWRPLTYNVTIIN